MLKEITLLLIGIVILFTMPYLLLIPAIIWYFISEHRKQQDIDHHNRTTPNNEPRVYTTPYMPYSEYRHYLTTSKWKALRLKTFKRDRYTCQHCGVTGSSDTLHCHHLTYDRLGDENLNDLLTLCNTCHKKVHN